MCVRRTIHRNDDAAFRIEPYWPPETKGSWCIVDECLHPFSDGVYALDLVKGRSDVIGLRSFRSFTEWPGFAVEWPSGAPIARQMETFGGWSAHGPITAVAAATQVEHEHLVSEPNR